MIGRKYNFFDKYKDSMHQCNSIPLYIRERLVHYMKIRS